MQEKMLSAREVADLLGVSADTIYRISQGYVAARVPAGQRKPNGQYFPICVPPGWVITGVRVTTCTPFPYIEHREDERYEQITAAERPGGRA